MIKVHKYGPAFGLPDGSPFVTKVETYLRLVGEPYETVIADVRKAPRRQLPCAEIGGQLVPDSSEIIEAIERRRPTRLDAHLSASERATALAFKVMLEEHLYFALLYLRWTTDGGWAVFEPTLREMFARMGVPKMLRGMIAKKAREQVSQRCRIQGMGRRPHAEIVALATGVLDALAVHLGDRPFLCGDRPTTFDATAYAFVAGALCPAFQNEVQQHARGLANLGAYAGRIEAAYWAGGPS
jgi:glutathione S-transferase